jgi:hypothetical protein
MADKNVLLSSGVMPTVLPECKWAPNHIQESYSIAMDGYPTGVLMSMGIEEAMRYHLFQ